MNSTTLMKWIYPLGWNPGARCTLYTVSTATSILKSYQGVATAFEIPRTPARPLCVPIDSCCSLPYYLFIQKLLFPHLFYFSSVPTCIFSLYFY